MKKSLLITLLTLLGTFLPVAAEGEKDCAVISATVTQEVTAKPQDVLAIVSAQVAASPTCACEIVKAAIAAAKANKDLVGQIVFSAVTAAPAEATTIAECAVAAAPEASETIKAALQGAMSDKNPDKNPGKNVIDKSPPVVREDLADFGLSPVAIGGVYLVYPSGGGTGGAGSIIQKDSQGRLFIIGPNGEKLFLSRTPPGAGAPRGGEGRVIIIRPPTQTAGTAQP
jgi:hypothetical protein